MSERMYRQCLLRRRVDARSHWETVSWVPEPYCVVGKVLKLRDGDGEWIDGWEVASANHYEPESEVNKMGRLYLKTRKYTDI